MKSGWNFMDRWSKKLINNKRFCIIFGTVTTQLIQWLAFTLIINCKPVTNRIITLDHGQFRDALLPIKTDMYTFNRASLLRITVCSVLLTMGGVQLSGFSSITAKIIFCRFLISNTKQISEKGWNNSVSSFASFDDQLENLNPIVCVLFRQKVLQGLTRHGKHPPTVGYYVNYVLWLS